MEDRLPFIAAIISEVIVFLAALFFFQDYLALTTLVLVLATLILRLNAWALIGGFLTGVAIDFFLKGATNELRVILLVLVVGSILQLMAVFVPRIVSEVRTPMPSAKQAAVFAMIGITLSIGSTLALCDPAPPLASQNAFEGLLYQFGECEARLAAGRYFDLQFDEVRGLALYNILALTCFRFFILLPTTWAAFFAALRVVNFNLLAPRQLLSQTFRAYLGAIFGGGILAAILQTPIILVILAVGSFSVSDQVTAWTQVLFALSMGIGLFAFALGAGWGAGWGMRSK